MRLSCSILLIGLVLSGWVEGFRFCFQQGCQADHSYDMSRVEQALTEKLEKEFLEGNVVKMVDKTFNGRRGWAYPGDFVYQAEIEGDTAYFILQQSPEEEESYSIVHLPGSQKEMPVRTASQDVSHWYIFELDRVPASAVSMNNGTAAWPPLCLRYNSATEACDAPPPETLLPRFFTA
jgi:hypothetical protein